MQIGIIGFGFVGSAIAWAHNHHDVLINDPKLSESVPLEKFSGCEGIYICVPSPMTEDGHCDTSILEEVLKNLEVEDTVPIISKVTAPPGTYKKLQKLYPNLVYSPEFLTAKNNVKDYMNAEYFIVGGGDSHAEKAGEIISSGVDVDILKTNIETASLFKYMMNTYLATKVTFMNDFFHIATHEGIDWKEIKKFINNDSRIGNTHIDVPGDNGKFGWGGYCFPKDTSAIIKYGQDENVRMELLERVNEINNKHRGNSDD